MARIDPLAAERAEKGGQGCITLSGPAFGETAAKRITLSGPAFGEPAAATTNRIQLSGPVFGDHSETTASRITLSGSAFGETASPSVPSALHLAKLQAADRLRRAAENAETLRLPPVGHDVYAPTPLGRVPSRNNDAHIVPDPTSTAAPTDTRSVTQPPYDASAPTPSVPFARSPAADPAATFTHSSGKLPAPVNGGLDELNRLRKERNEGAAAYASGDPDEAMAQWKRQNEIDAQIAALERSLKAQGVDTTLGDLDPIDAVHGTVWKGISGFAEGSAKALDLANRLGHYALGWTPEEYDAQDTLTAQLLSQQKENTRYWSERVAEDVQHDPAALVASDLGAAAVRAVPSAILAMLSSGASLAGETTAGLASAANTAGISSKTGPLADTLTRIVTNASQNPQFYSSFWNVVGEGYEKAKANGASEANAISYAAANGLFNALIEIGGGIEDTSGAKSFRETANEEGMEEVGQGVFERGLEWMYGKKNKPFSLRDPEAVVNPVTAAKEYTGGAAVGGLLGGVRTAVNALAADEYDGTDSPQAEADEAEEPGRRTQPSQQAEELNHPNLAIEAKETATENQHDVRMREKASADAIKEDMSDGGNRRMTEADIEKWMNTGTTGHRKHQKQRNIAAGLNVVLTSKDQMEIPT